MTLEELQPSIVATVITGIFGFNAMFFKWLMHSFSKLRETIRSQEEATREWLYDHEDKDQSRHEENLYRFEKISVALARMGSTNGTHDKDKN